MTKRSGLLVFLAVTLVGLTLFSRGPRSRTVPVMTDRPTTVHSAAAAASARVVEGGRAKPAVALPRYTDPDRAGIAAFVDGRYHEAVTVFEQAVEDDRRDAESFSNLGQALVRLGRHEEAIGHFETALAIDSSRWAYRVNLADAYDDVGRWDRAVAEYRAAAELAPREYVIHYDLGRALHEEGDDQAAVRAYRTAIALDPTEPSAYLSLGVSYETLESWDAALEGYERYLTLAPDSPQAEALKRHVVAMMEKQDRSRAGG